MSAQSDGARWQKIGEIISIDYYENIEFTFDISELEREHVDLESSVKKIRPDCDSKLCEGRVDVLSQSLTQSRTELDEILSHAKKPHGRRKRMDSVGSYLRWGTGVMDSEDRDDINRVLSNIQSDKYEMSSRLANVQDNLSKTKTQVKTQLDNLFAIEYLAMKVKGFAAKIESFCKTLGTGKFGSVVDNKAIDRKLNEIKSSLDSNHMLVFWSGTLCKRYLEVETEVTGKIVKFSMEVPIVYKQRLSLNRFIRTPIKVSNSIAVLNFDMTFVVLGDKQISSSKIKVVENLSSCINRLDGVYICKTESDGFRDSFDKCLSGIVFNRTLDAELCASEVFVARLPSTVYIWNDVKELWYHSETPKTFNTMCGKEDGNLTITGYGFIQPAMPCEVTLTKGEAEEEESFMTIKLGKQESSGEVTAISFNLKEIPSINASPVLGNDQFYDIEQFIKSATTLSDLLQIGELLENFHKARNTSSLAKVPLKEGHKNGAENRLLLIAPVIIAMLITIVMLWRHERKIKANVSDFPSDKIIR